MNVLKVSMNTIFTFLLTAVLCGKPEAARLHATNSNFLDRMCAKTTYPQVCVSSLTPYTSTIQNSTVHLARASVSVSLDSAQSAMTLVTRLTSDSGLSPSEASAVRDCAPTMGDCVMVLQKALDTMVTTEEKLAGDWMQMDNVKTWVSAALTDENTCALGFTGGEKAAAKVLKKKVNDAMQRTSNALALLALIGPGST